MVQSKIEIPIFCENDKCQNYGKLINLVRGIRLEDIDLFYENYGNSANDNDYCKICGELGVIEDAYFSTRKR